MVFNSLTFAIFFAIVWATCRLLRSWPLRKAFLLMASYFFYAAWNPWFLGLLWFSTALDWYAAQAIAATNRPALRRLWVGASLVGNLVPLLFFKYGNFLVANFEQLGSMSGSSTTFTTLDIVLPAGISFYTFQTLSYMLDVYQGKTKPYPSLLDFALYVTFFPQLVAGPIVRSEDFLPQCVEPREANADQLGWGLTLLLLGLFAKVCVADQLLAPHVDTIFAASDRASCLEAWLGAAAFSGQIYFDFAGYSLCAIGAALCLGFEIKDNFHFPYAAVGFSDFWTRWHISLSTWLRDYLYIPLGGNRRGPIRTGINLLITMLLGGLWHGANWTFVAWGALHGGYLIVERLVRGSKPTYVSATSLPGFGGAIVTYALVCVAWVFFRATNFETAGQLLAAMAGLGPVVESELLPALNYWTVGSVIAVMFLGQWCLRNTTLEALAARTPAWLLAVIIALLALLILLSPGVDRAFIYFQF